MGFTLQINTQYGLDKGKIKNCFIFRYIRHLESNFKNTFQNFYFFPLFYYKLDSKGIAIVHISHTKIEICKSGI